MFRFYFSTLNRSDFTINGICPKFEKLKKIFFFLEPRDKKTVFVISCNQLNRKTYRKK